MAAVFVASLSIAQEKIADDDLLKMLETANSAPVEKPEPPADSATKSNPIERTLESVQVADERTVVSDAVIDVDAASNTLKEEAGDEKTTEAEEAQAVEIEDEAAEEQVVDDFGMVSYEDETASSAGELISVRLNRVGLEEAINLFAQLSGANIIVPELTEAAQISVNLKDVEWRPALQSILDSYNYELYQKVSGSNVYSVRRRPVGAPEPQVVETFQLRYATVPNAAALVRALLPEDAKISEFASRNMLVVKSTESSLSEVRSVLQSIDTVRQQVFIESKFMELSDGAQKDLGVDWQVLKNYSAGTVGSTQRQYTETDEDNTERNSFKDALGRPYADGDGFIDGDTLDGNFPVYEGLTPLVKKTGTEGSSEILTSVLSADEFRLVLSALEENTGVNVVSNPKIIVANEEKANISIVRKEPNLKQERQQSANEATLDNITFTLDEDMPFFEYGIKLDVTPSINTSSNITVNINPSLTRFVADKPAGDNTYPIIDEKSIQTVFNLSSGETAAIGGLTEVTDSEAERKVPLLGSIPFLGRLFSWKQTISDQRETIIFVTVGLANTQQIDLETGLPEDSELARRQLIRDKNRKALRDKGREYYKAEENDKLNDMLKALDEEEAMRLEKRAMKQKAERATVASTD